MSEEVGYGLKEPFDIDGGELDGQSPQDIFCLGYEWCKFESMLENGERFYLVLHRGNKERMQRMCIRRGRKYKFKNTAEGWCDVEVEAA